MDAMADAGARAETVRIGGVGLAVRDLPATTAFYRDVIGLELIEATGESAALGAGGAVFVELLHRPDARPDDPRTAGLYHTAFLMPSRIALADWLEHVAETGAKLDGASDHAVSEAIYLSDPEGNGVEVYADRPRDTWVWEDGQIDMTTLRLDLHALLAVGSRKPWLGAPAQTRIGHVHLRVGDVPTAVAFWTGTIGLELVRGWREAAFMSTGRYHHHIAANTWHSAGAGPRDPDRAGLHHITLQTAAPRAETVDPWGTRVRFDADQ
jgi:catechol 2,3-dioxygenase